MEYADLIPESGGVYSPISITRMIVHDLDNGPATKTLHDLCVRVTVPMLGQVQTITDHLLHLCRKRLQVLLRRPYPDDLLYLPIAMLALA